MPHLLEAVQAGVADWPVQPRVIVGEPEKKAAFRIAHAALVKSGTVTLELALAGVPTVAAYRLHAIEAIVARLIRIQSRLPSVILANLVIGENVVPELLQEDCTPEQLADALLPLLSDTLQRWRQIEAFGRLDDIMAIGTEAPSAKAAAIVIDAARRGRHAAAISEPR
jgi:lipid-A-disaccharide synthase